MLMNDAFLYGSKHLIKSWKTLRKQLTDELTDIEHLKLVVDFWSFAPISFISLNWDEPENWLDPWQLVNSQMFDESSISLAMFYTLLLSNDNRWNKDRLSLILIKDSKRHIQRIVLKVDDRYYLNLDYKLVVDSISTPLQLMKQQLYIFNGKKHNVYDKKNIIKVNDNVGNKKLNTKPRKITEE